jgi:Domain of unknown function (DUF4252)
MNTCIGRFALACLFLPALAAAGDARLTLPDFRGIEDKATESVNISLNPWLLNTLAAFMDEKDADEAATRKLLAGIKSIEVRSYQFADDFAYAAADITAVRQQLAAPGWSRVMQVHDAKKNEDVDMYLLVENEHTRGFALIASEPREFTIINIVGSINVEDLKRLEGRLHLPKFTVAQSHLML